MARAVSRRLAGALPQRGPASEIAGGGTWGFHGEASRIPWQVRATSEGSDSPHPWVELQTRLTGAPLVVRRRITLAAALLQVAESVTNTGPDPLEIMWSHHPAFGAPLVGEGARIATGARTITADDGAPGTDLAPGSQHAWPHATTASGAPLDLAEVPGESARRATFAYLGDFTDGWYALTNEHVGLGVGLRWDIETFPSAWFWQEMRASPGHPWWREAYVCAIEPASTVPGQGIAAARAKGGHLVHLAAGQTRATQIEAVLFAPEGEVTRVAPGGRIEYARSGGE